MGFNLDAFAGGVAKGFASGWKPELVEKVRANKKADAIANRKIEIEHAKTVKAQEDATAKSIIGYNKTKSDLQSKAAKALSDGSRSEYDSAIASLKAHNDLVQQDISNTNAITGKMKGMIDSYQGDTGIELADVELIDVDGNKVSTTVNSDLLTIENLTDTVRVGQDGTILVRPMVDGKFQDKDYINTPYQDMSSKFKDDTTGDTSKFAKVTYKDGAVKEGVFTDEQLLTLSKDNSVSNVKKQYKPSEDSNGYTWKDLPKEAQDKALKEGKNLSEPVTNSVYNSYWGKDKSKGSFKTQKYTQMKDGKRVGTIEATTQEQADEYDNNPTLIKGTIDKDPVKRFESKKEEKKYDANMAASAIDLGKLMNSGKYDGSKNTEELIELENAAIERMSPADKKSLSSDEDYQIIADEMSGYADKIEAMYKDGKLKFGVAKTTIANIGRYFPNLIKDVGLGNIADMSIEDIKTNLKLQGEGENINAEFIKILSGLAATDKEFARKFKANIGSWFSDPEILVSELNKTRKQIESRGKARQAKWRSKGVVQRFETKVKPTMSNITKEDVANMSEDELDKFIAEQLKLR